MESKELKPCPFCGSRDIVSQHNTQGDYETHYHWEVWCNNDKCGHGEVFGPSLPAAKSKAVAESQWNTRPIEDAQQQRIDGLEWEKAKLQMECIKLREERIFEFKPKIDRLVEALTGGVYSIKDCLDTLADAADLLLFDNNYDGDGYEIIGHARDEARKHIDKIKAALKASGVEI